MNTEGNIPTQRSPADPPKRLKSRRAGKAWWKILLLLLVVCLIGAGLAYQLIFAARRSSEPYQLALKQAQQDKNLKEQIGSPIQDAAWFPQGSINTQEGIAYLEFRVAGPKGDATIHVNSELKDGKWWLKRLEAFPAGGRPIQIDMGEASNLDVAPGFNPPPKQGQAEKDKSPQPGKKTDEKPPTIDLKIPE
jgi:hypothetical protein